MQSSSGCESNAMPNNRRHSLVLTASMRFTFQRSNATITSVIAVMIALAAKDTSPNAKTDANRTQNTLRSELGWRLVHSAASGVKARMKSNECVTPRCISILRTGSTKGPQTTSRSGIVAAMAPHSIALLPSFLPRTISPMAAPMTMCVSESIQAGTFLNGERSSKAPGFTERTNGPMSLLASTLRCFT